MLGIKTEGGGFAPLVFENVVDTYPGGVIVDVTGYAPPSDGFIPEGTLIGRNTTTGIGVIVADPASPGTNVKLLGLSYRPVKSEANALVGVVISGTARIDALPANEKSKAAAIATALPRITLV